MRNLLFGLILLFQFYSVKASHDNGGEIFYEHISGTTSTYRVVLVKFDSLLAPQLSYSSSCNSGGSVIMTQFFNPPAYSTQNCMFPATFPSNYWETTITLPTNCNDWEFIYHNCCLTSDLDNIAPNTSVSNFIVARLNNNIGQNSSPVFIDPPAGGFCISNSPFTWFQRVNESEGDSVVINFSAINYFWAPGYSANSPISTLNGIQVNKAQGTFTFQPTQVELVLISVEVEEYRFDFITGNWIFIGSIMRHLPVPVYGQCDSTWTNWSIGERDLNNEKLPAYMNCNDSLLSFSTSSTFQCNTLVPTDFALYRSNGNIVPITNAFGNCIQGFSDSIILETHTPLNQNDTLFLVSRLGADGNTLSNTCGFDLAVNDTTMVIVQGCSGIGLAEKSIETLHIYPNPVSETLNLSFDSQNLRSIRLIEPSGKIISNQIFNSKELQMDLSAQKKGLYLLQIQSENEIHFYKILKE